MRSACIDIGSNTTRLLVAELDADGRLRVVLSQRAFTRLGGAVGVIPAGKVAEVAEVVAGQVDAARAHGAHTIRAVATAAIRRSANAEAFAAAVLARSGLALSVLSEAEEARLAFAGATRTLGHAAPGLVGVVDVGGGSSELVAGTLAGGVTWSVSLAVGSGVLADAHLRSDPPSPAELDAVAEHLARVFAGLQAPRPAAAYAVGGSATSLRRLIGPVLDHDALRAGLRALVGMPVAAAARRFDLHPERARLLPAGILLLDAAARAFGAPLRICAGGLREGVVLEEMGKA